MLGLPRGCGRSGASKGGGMAASRSATPSTVSWSSFRSTHPPRRSGRRWTRRFAGGIRRSPTTSSNALPTFVDAYCASPLASRLASSKARDGTAVHLEHDGVLIRGRLDVLWQEGRAGADVDYKSNALEGRDPQDIVEAEYRAAATRLSLVSLRAGSSEVEVAYQFLERPDAVVSTSFLELTSPRSKPSSPVRSHASAPATFDRRRASSSADCPALDLVCAGPRLALSRKIRAMRVAAISDIHGNLPALEAVLADIARERVDSVVVAEHDHR